MIQSPKLESLLESIRRKVQQMGRYSNIDERVTHDLVYQYGQDLGIKATRVWKVGKTHITLKEQKGDGKDIKPGYRIPIEYVPINETLLNGYYLTNKDAPGFNTEIEGLIGSENSLQVMLSPKTLLSIELESLKGAKTALYLLRTALENAKRKKEIEDINEIASEIERSLLPKKEDLTRLNEFCDVAWYAKAAKVVRGDYLKFKPIGMGSTAIAIGDAKGKGISASIVTLATHTAFEAMTEEDIRASVLTGRINRTLYKTDITQQPMSLFYSTLHPNGTLNYVNAGHPQPFHFHKSGVDRLDKGGMILGARSESEYAPGAANMSIGDLLFLYTDGLYEITNKTREELAISGLENLVDKYKNRPSQEIIDNVLAGARSYSSRKNFQDDITFAAIKRIK